MKLMYLLCGIVLMFGAGELYAEYRNNLDRKTLWLCIAGVLIGTMNLISAVGYA